MTSATLSGWGSPGPAMDEKRVTSPGPPSASKRRSRSPRRRSRSPSGPGSRDRSPPRKLRSHDGPPGARGDRKPAVNGNSWGAGPDSGRPMERNGSFGPPSRDRSEPRPMHDRPAERRAGGMSGGAPASLVFENLPPNFTITNLERLVSGFGPILLIGLAGNSYCKQVSMPECAIVEFADRRAAEDCKKAFNNTPLEGRRLAVDWHMIPTSRSAASSPSRGRPSSITPSRDADFPPPRPSSGGAWGHDDRRERDGGPPPPRGGFDRDNDFPPRVRGFERDNGPPPRGGFERDNDFHPPRGGGFDGPPPRGGGFDGPPPPRGGGFDGPPAPRFERDIGPPPVPRGRGFEHDDRGSGGMPSGPPPRMRASGSNTDPLGPRRPRTGEVIMSSDGPPSGRGPSSAGWGHDGHESENRTPIHKLPLPPRPNGPPGGGDPRTRFEPPPPPQRDNAMSSSVSSGNTGWDTPVESSGGAWGDVSAESSGAWGDAPSTSSEPASKPASPKKEKSSEPGPEPSTASLSTVTGGGDDSWGSAPEPAPGTGW